MTIAEEVHRVETLYPQMELIWNTWWGAYWTGELRGFEGQPPYKVGILFTAFAPRPFALRYPGLRVKAWLIDPPLQNRIEDGVEIRPPHIWKQFNDAMCFYKPWDDGLDYDVDIARTVIPWIIKWLAAYELWLATGTWVGPQAHPEGRAEASGSEAPPVIESYPSAMSYAVARRMHVHGSGHLLSAASAGCFTWPWNRRWHISPAEVEAAIFAALISSTQACTNALKAA